MEAGAWDPATVVTAGPFGEAADDGTEEVAGAEWSETPLGLVRGDVPGDDGWSARGAGAGVRVDPPLKRDEPTLPTMMTATSRQRAKAHRDDGRRAISVTG